MKYEIGQCFKDDEGNYYICEELASNNEGCYYRGVVIYMGKRDYWDTVNLTACVENWSDSEYCVEKSGEMELVSLSELTEFFQVAIAKELESFFKDKCGCGVASRFKRVGEKRKGGVPCGIEPSESNDDDDENAIAIPTKEYFHG